MLSLFFFAFIGVLLLNNTTFDSVTVVYLLLYRRALVWSCNDSDRYLASRLRVRLVR